MPNILKTESKEVFNSDEHYNETGYNYYSTTTIERDRWGVGDTNQALQDAIMEDYETNGGRIYKDGNNAMRFKVNQDSEKDQDNDYYCVAMGIGFAQTAADYCGYSLIEEYDTISKWGFTFKVEFIDDNNNSHYINIIMVDEKAQNEDYDKDEHDNNILESNPWALNPFTPHRNNVIEFITYDSNGFKGTPVGTGINPGDGVNLSYDRLFGSTGVKISSISAYKDGYFVTQTLQGDKWVVNLLDHRYGIPTTSDMPQNNIEEYIKRLEKLMDNGAVPSDAKADIERELARVKGDVEHEKPGETAFEITEIDDESDGYRPDLKIIELMMFTPVKPDVKKGGGG